MKYIVILLGLLSVTACAATPQGGVQGRAPAAGSFNPETGSQTGSK